MKKFLRAMMIAGVIGAVGLFSTITVSAQDIVEKCQYQASNGTNPDFKTMNCLLTETAIAYDVPPEIVKAIAEVESGDWKHFDDNGNVIVTEDNGIGVMQITNQSGYDQDRLKNDVAYNIKAGVEILDRMYKRSDLPTINRGERDILENWYFSIMAYNGTKPVNSPIKQATGERNTEAYQEKIIKKIEDYGLLKLQALPFETDDFKYDTDSNENIEFVTPNFHFTLPLTKSKHAFEKGEEVVTTTATRLRTSPTTDSTHFNLNPGEVLTIEGSFKYEESNPKNHFVWYPVKRSNGQTGYVASSYIKLKFKDIPGGHYAEKEINFLVDRGIINGVGNGNFGLGRDLTRWQAVLILTRANNVSLDNRPNPGFTDVPNTHLYYKEIAAAVDEGLFEGKSETSFDPDATLTRAEMSKVLQRLFQFPATTKTHTFTDVKANAWYAEEVSRLFSAGITNGKSTNAYGPSDKLSREDFAIFMTRSMDASYRIK